MKTILLFCLLFLSQNIYSQDFTANYSLTIHFPQFSLDYSAKYFSSNNKVVYYLEPLYLEKYPDKYITVKGANYGVPFDSIQQYTLVNLDSNVIWNVQVYGSGTKTKFEPGCLYWKIFPETRVINNLICQRAVWSQYDGGKEYGEIWFCPDIPMPVGLNMLTGLPGLMMEMDMYGSAKATLINFSFEEKIDPVLFWPPKFNSIKFRDGRIWRKSTGKPEEKKRKNSDAEIQNIMNQ